MSSNPDSDCDASALPDPLTPPDADLRSFRFMPLDVARLRDSNLAAVEDPEIFRASVLAWCASWHRVPAGSLPVDDHELARLLGYGRDIECWRRVRAAGGLHGWTKCSDGLLYHPVVAEEVRAAWSRKKVRRESGRRGNVKRWGVARGSLEDRNCDRNSDRKDRTGQDNTGTDISTAANVFSAGSVTPPPKARRADRESGSIVASPFDEFWQAYPLKVAKRAAETAHSAALRRGATPEAILTGLKRARFSPDQHFIPHASTWLNGGRWTDEAPAPRAANVSAVRGAL